MSTLKYCIVPIYLPCPVCALFATQPSYQPAWLVAMELYGIVMILKLKFSVSLQKGVRLTGSLRRFGRQCLGTLVR